MRTRKVLVILLSGIAGAGKTSASSILRELIKERNEGLETVPYSFSDPIKFVAQAFIGWNKEKDDKGRRLLQSIGKIGREYNPDVWVKHFLTQLDRRFGRKDGVFPVNIVAIDDWRFPNELETLRKNPLIDVVTVRIFGRDSIIEDESLKKDTSEISLPEVGEEYIGYAPELGNNLYDFCIENSGDLELLRAKLTLVIAQLEKQYIVE